MSHVAHVKRVMSHIRMRHVAHTNGPCRTRGCLMSHIESCRTCECVKPHIWRNHLAHANTPCRYDSFYMCRTVCRTNVRRAALISSTWLIPYVSRDTGLFGGNTGLFCKNVGLFGGDIGSMCLLSCECATCRTHIFNRLMSYVFHVLWCICATWHFICVSPVVIHMSSMTPSIYVSHFVIHLFDMTHTCFTFCDSCFRHDSFHLCFTCCDSYVQHNSFHIFFTFVIHIFDMRQERQACLKYIHAPCQVI